MSASNEHPIIRAQALAGGNGIPGVRVARVKSSGSGGLPLQTCCMALFGVKCSADCAIG